MKLIKNSNVHKALNVISRYQSKNDPEACRNALLELTEEVNIDSLGNKYAVISEKHDKTYDPYIRANVDVRYLFMLSGYVIAKNGMLTNPAGNKISCDQILCEI